MNIITTLIDFLGSKTGIFSQTFNRPMKALIAIVGAVLVWFILKMLIAIFEKKALKIKFIQIQPDIIKIFRKVLIYLLFLITAHYLIHLFGFLSLKNALFAVFIMLFARQFNLAAIITLHYLSTRLADNTETKVDDIIIDLLDKFAGVLIFAAAVIMALDTLGVNVMPFIAGAGVAGVAIGFAAKDTLSNLIAGILLIIDRPFEIGDRIEVWSAPSGSATWGDVVDIGLRATKIKTTDNIMIIIPNNEIMKRDIVNYTISSTKIRVRINIGVAYDTDIDKAKKVIIEIAKQADWIATNPLPKVVVRNFGDSSVDLQLRVWIDNARKRMDTISFITDQVKTAFDKAGIEIPYPKRDITVINQGNKILA